MKIFITDFALRHFDPEFAGTKITDRTPQEFLTVLNSMVDVGLPVEAPGYAPFCKHLFVDNFTNAEMGVCPIIDDNRHLLKFGYKARREEELPVFESWFERQDLLNRGYRSNCTGLDLVLYSAEQLREEGVSVPGGMEWGVVAILSAEEPSETPMKPITMMRNALGKEHGGSGVPIDPAAYQAAVDYWSKHATVK